MTKKTKKDKKNKAATLPAAEENVAGNAFGAVGQMLGMLVILSLGALIGREVHRYEVQHTDELRIKQLIEALEKKPVHVEIHPLVPFRVPPNRVPPKTNTRPLDKLTIVRKDSLLCLSPLPNRNPINVHQRY